MDCILSLFYIKPQLNSEANNNEAIVSYLFSTSNHNIDVADGVGIVIVSYLFSTSNHNQEPLR